MINQGYCIKNIKWLIKDIVLRIEKYWSRILYEEEKWLIKDTVFRIQMID